MEGSIRTWIEKFGKALFFGVLIVGAAGAMARPAAAQILLNENCEAPNTFEPTPGFAAGVPDVPAFVPGQIIVKVSTVEAFDTFLPNAEQLGFPRVQILRVETPMMPLQILLELSPLAQMSRDELEAITINIQTLLNGREDVEYAILNYIVYGQAATNDPCYALQWHYFNNGQWSVESSPGGIGLPTAWQVQKGLGRVTVAVIDSGIGFTSTDLNALNIVLGRDFIDGDFDATDPGVSTRFHGTHVAGTVGALATDNGFGAASINWAVQIQPIRILGPALEGTLLDLARAIYWAAGGVLTDGVPNPTPADIINLSLAMLGPCSAAPALDVRAAIAFAMEQQKLIVAAAGNWQVDVAGVTPAGCDGVLSVAASGADGAIVSRYSAYGAGIDLLAPGGDTTKDRNGDGVADGVLSMTPYGPMLMNGTSMAAPHVSGLAALLLASQGIGTPPATLEQLLEEAALDRSLAQCPLGCGAGLLSAVGLFP